MWMCFFLALYVDFIALTENPDIVRKHQARVKTLSQDSMSGLWTPRVIHPDATADKLQLSQFKRDLSLLVVCPCCCYHYECAIVQW